MFFIQNNLFWYAVLFYLRYKNTDLSLAMKCPAMKYPAIKCPAMKCPINRMIFLFANYPSKIDFPWNVQKIKKMW